MHEAQFISGKIKFHAEEGILFFLLILYLAGIAITDYSPDDGYWLIMVFVFALFASLVILLLLSLATMLDGLRIGWCFSQVGLYLGISSVIRCFLWSYYVVRYADRNNNSCCYLFLGILDG
ncbi:MAG: hypothetical protein L3J59_01310 [Methylococcaceae bacterium]|nr:hypothetical protein [Methylococcaceae bacterium]